MALAKSRDGGTSNMTTTTEHCYVVKDDQILGGEPVVKGTRTPVRAIVEMWRLGVAPEEVPTRLPHSDLAFPICSRSKYRCGFLDGTP